MNQQDNNRSRRQPVGMSEAVNDTHKDTGQDEQLNGPDPFQADNCPVRGRFSENVSTATHSEPVFKA